MRKYYCKFIDTTVFKCDIKYNYLVSAKKMQ